MKTILNVHNGARPPVKKLPPSSFSLDFASSDDAVEVDTGIRETM